MQTGATHEGMNIAAVEQVPLVMVATNNHFAYSTPNDREFACARPGRSRQGLRLRRAHASTAPTSRPASKLSKRRCNARAPAGLHSWSSRPSLRLAGHGEHDDASYVPPDMRQEPFAQDALCNGGAIHSSNRNCWMREALQKMRAEIAARSRRGGCTRRSRKTRRMAQKEDWCALSTRELTDHIRAYE